MECHEEPPLREVEALAALRASPLVKQIGINSGSKQGVYARLWCARECHPARDSEQLNILKKRTTLDKCAEDLLELINAKHGNHLEAPERERVQVEAAEVVAASGPSVGGRMVHCEPPFAVPTFVGAFWLWICPG